MPSKDVADEDGEEVEELEGEVYAETDDEIAVSAGDAAVQGWEELLVEDAEECNGDGGVKVDCGGVDAERATIEHTTKQMEDMRHG